MDPWLISFTGEFFMMLLEFNIGVLFDVGLSIAEVSFLWGCEGCTMEDPDELTIGLETSLYGFDVCFTLKLCTCLGERIETGFVAIVLFSVFLFAGDMGVFVTFLVG